MMRVTRSMKRNEKNPPAELKIVNRMSSLVLDPRIERQRRIAAGVESRMDSNEYTEVGKLTRTVRFAVTTDNPGQNKRKKQLTAIGWDEESLNSSPHIIKSAMDLHENVNVDYRNPPPGVLGAGLGTVNGLPAYEFRSVWQTTVLPELDAKDPAPWRQDPAVPPTHIKPIVLSITATVSLGTALNLEDIAEKGKNINYDPDAFTPLIMRLRQPKATALVFNTGSMVLSGTKSESDCHIAARKFARMIQKIGYRVSVKGLQIQNISARCNLGFQVRVHLFGGDKLLSTQIGYHPELFTGVSIPLVNPKVKVTIFRTGSILLGGAKQESDLQEALEIIYPFAKMYAN